MEKRTHPTADRGRVMLALVALVWLAGCGSAPKPEPGGPAKPVAPASSASPPPAPAAAPAVPPPAALPPPLAAAEVPATLRAAQGLLQEGDADAARELVQRVLAVEAGNAQALSYQRQIEGDPQALLGRESYAHVVRPGESLSSIARDRLRDTNLFYALARYNNIKVPRQLAAGQTIRIPGRAPAAAAPSPAPTPAQPPAPAAAPAPVQPAAPAVEPPAPASAPAQDKARRMADFLRRARVAFARQDLCASVGLYDQVLELDAHHPQARQERQRSLDLIERLRKQGGKLDC